MIYQTDDEFDPDIQQYGCGFLSLVWLINDYLSLGIWDYEHIKKIYYDSKLDLTIGAECYINDWQSLCDHIAKKRIKFVGKMSATFQIRENQFEIQQWYNPNTDFYHFVAAKYGNVAYDPIKNSRTIREGHLFSKRIFAIL